MYPSREAFLAEAARVLVPNGYFGASDILVTTRFFNWRASWDKKEVRPCLACSVRVMLCTRVLQTHL